MKPIFRPAAARRNSSTYAPARFGAVARRIGMWTFGCYAWLIFCVVVLTCGTLIAILRRPTWARPVARAAARLIFRLACMPVSVRGLERLPDGPHILLLNHTSFLDGIALSALLPPRPGYAFVVKQQYRRQALLWPLLNALGTLLLSHSTPGHRTANVEKLTAALCGGKNLVIFPEGGIGPEAGLRKFHSGTFIAAARANVPIVVAGMRGARTALRLGTWLPHRAPIHLEIGPILVPGGRDPLSVQRMIRQAHEAMAPLTGEEELPCSG